MGSIVNVIDSSSSNGLKNYLINGNMDFNQRYATGGTTGSFTGGAKIATDRWKIARGLGAFSGNVQGTQVSTVGVLPGSNYCLRVQRPSGDASSNIVFLCHDLETKTSLLLLNKPITISFWARAGANFSGSGTALTMYLVGGTGTDNTQTGPFTGNSAIANTSVTLTTTFQRFVFTISTPLATTFTQFGLQWFYTPTGTAGTNDYFDITQVSLQEGIHSNPGFQLAGGSIGAELALCQRYYEKSYDESFAPGTAVTQGSFVFVANGTAPTMSIFFKVTKRTSPTIIYYSPATGASGQLRDESTSVDVAAVTNRVGNNILVEQSSGLTSGRQYSMHWISDAEL